MSEPQTRAAIVFYAPRGDLGRRGDTRCNVGCCASDYHARYPAAREVVDAAPPGSLSAPAAQSGPASLPVGIAPLQQPEPVDPVSSAVSQPNIDELQALLEKIARQLKQNNDANHYLDQRLEAISSLERSIASLIATDLNNWLSYRTPWIPEKKQQEILLSSVQHLFAPGLDPKFYRKFKHNIRDDIAAIRQIHSGFDVEISGDFLILRNSAPAVPFTQIKRKRYS